MKRWIKYPKIKGGEKMKFGDILKGAEAEGKEKHVPIIEIDKGREIGRAHV